MPSPSRPKPKATPKAAPKRRLDLSVPGGRYLVAGQLVDAHGKPITEPEQA